MQFCEECGSMMKADGDRMVCTGCEAVSLRDKDQEAAFVSTDTQTGAELVESDASANFEGKPIASDVRCDDCGNDEAWYTIKQTGAADEPPTRFFKCTECGYRWRGYS
ncbi:transcription factor S [Halovivax gelatinilyticus]|uniref:transcription factor S n=1 Tax=Halovivax gelatinilyticus TaxID=2961597 RepID=UPI0020CA2A71|nr:transcription factor S [Halovivax gelatinilyticus]